MKRSRADVAVQLVVESIRGFRDGGAPHTVLTGPAAMAASTRVETTVRADSGLTQHWKSLRTRCEPGWNTPETLWDAVANQIGPCPAGTSLAMIEHAISTGGRNLLVFVDRFDRLLSALAENDCDWSLRKTLQTERRILLIASAPELPAQATGYERAFYCFFTHRKTEAETAT